MRRALIMAGIFSIGLAGGWFLRAEMAVVACVASDGLWDSASGVCTGIRRR